MNYKVILILLLYLFQSNLDLTKKSLKFNKLVQDFVFDMEKEIKLSSDLFNFKLSVAENSLSMPSACYKLRSRFLKFINKIIKLCYDERLMN